MEGLQFSASNIWQELGYFQVLCPWPWHFFFWYPNRHSLGSHSTESWHPSKPNKTCLGRKNKFNEQIGNLSLIFSLNEGIGEALWITWRRGERRTKLMFNVGSAAAMGPAEPKGTRWQNLLSTAPWAVRAVGLWQREQDCFARVYN